MSELWAALCLVVVIEGLLLFAAPRFWKQAVEQMLEQPISSLRVAGGIMIVIGVVCLQVVR